MAKPSLKGAFEVDLAAAGDSLVPQRQASGERGVERQVVISVSMRSDVGRQHGPTYQCEACGLRTLLWMVRRSGPEPS